MYMYVNCKNCGDGFKTSKSANKIYCSNSCQQEFQGKEIIAAWFSGEIGMYHAGLQIRKPIRTYLIKEANNECSKCGWHEVNETTGTSPLEIDHIDGNWLNEAKENLRVLCPNCHSLTPTHKALNKGNGRSYRRSLPL
jgi:hypothetical protein